MADGGNQTEVRAILHKAGLTDEQIAATTARNRSRNRALFGLRDLTEANPLPGVGS